MVTVDENGTATPVVFSEVNFNANTTAEASNIQENDYVVDDTKVAINYLRNGSIVQAEKKFVKNSRR